MARLIAALVTLVLAWLGVLNTSMAMAAPPTPPAAVDRGSDAASPRPDPGTSLTTYTYNDPVPLVQVEEGAPATLEAAGIIRASVQPSTPGQSETCQRDRMTSTSTSAA